MADSESYLLVSSSFRSVYTTAAGSDLTEFQVGRPPSSISRSSWTVP